MDCGERSPFSSQSSINNKYNKTIKHKENCRSRPRAMREWAESLSAVGARQSVNNGQFIKGRFATFPRNNQKCSLNIYNLKRKQCDWDDEIYWRLNRETKRTDLSKEWSSAIVGAQRLYNIITSFFHLCSFHHSLFWQPFAFQTFVPLLHTV